MNSDKSEAVVFVAAMVLIVGLVIAAIVLSSGWQ